MGGYPLPPTVYSLSNTSLALSTHPNKQFPGHFVDHMPLCLNILLCVTCPLCFPWRGGVVGYPHHKRDWNSAIVELIGHSCHSWPWVYLMRNVPEPDCSPQGLEPPCQNLLPSLLQNLPNLVPHYLNTKK